MDNLDLEKLNSNLNSIGAYLDSKWKVDKNTAFYKEILDECMQIIAGSKQVEEFFKDLADRKLLNVGACETTWQFGDAAYKCKTCQLDPTSALCISCFKTGDHEGHEYSLQSVGGGFCDCGDPTAFKPSGFCSRHKEQKTDITKYPQRFLLALCYCVQFVLKKIYYFFEEKKIEEYELLMDWLLKLAQRGDIVKVIVIKYISNTNIGNSHLLPPSPFQVPLLRLFFAPDKDSNNNNNNNNSNKDNKRFLELGNRIQHRMKESFANFSVFLRGSVEFIESFIRIILPIYKDCLIYSQKHILLSSYSIFSSTAMGPLLLSESASEIVMDTITEFFSRYQIERNSLYINAKKVHMKEPYRFPQFKYITYLNSIPPHLNTLRTDINFILSNPSVSSHVLNTQSSLAMWFNMIGISQGMNPNIQFMPCLPIDWLTAFTMDIAFSQSLFYIVNSIPLDKGALDSTLAIATQYLGKWMLGWLEFRNNYLVEKQQKLIQLKEESKDTPVVYNQQQQLISNLKLDSNSFLKNIKTLLTVDIKRDGFTFHLPLHRMISAIIYKCFLNLSNEYKSSGSLKAIFNQIIGTGSLITIEDYGKASTFHPLSILAALGEIKSGMWRAHGREEDMSLQAIMYQSLHFQKYYDLDIFLIQIGSLLMGPNEFINHTLAIYKLTDYFKFEKDPNNNNNNNSSQQAPVTPSKSLRQSSGSVKTSNENTPTTETTSISGTTATTTATTTTTLSKEEKKEKKEKAKKEEELQKKKTLSEDYLQTVIMLSTNKMLCGMVEEQIIRKEIIHRLCLADCTHSQMTRNIKSRLVNHPQFENILKEVSVYHQPQKTEQGKYQLKESCWGEFDGYFPHYNTQDLQTAEERYSEFVNKTKNNIARGLFINYPVFPGFEGLNALLCSRELHQILFTILQNQLINSPRSSDTLFNHALNALELLIIQTLSSDIKSEDLDKLSTIYQQQQLEKEKQQQKQLSTPSKKGTSLNSSIEVIESFSDISFPSQRNIFVNSIVQVQISEQKKISLLILLVKLTSSSQVNAEPKRQIQNIINCLMENNQICKQTVEDYLTALKAKKQPLAGSRKEDPEEEKKRIARTRQAAILAQMKTQQAAFKFDDDDEDDYEDEVDLKTQKKHEKVNSNALIVDGCESVTTCALCREAGSLSRPMGRFAFIQPSSILMLSKLTPDERKHRITEAVLKELSTGDDSKSNKSQEPVVAQPQPQGLHDLLGQEMDEDIEDVDMGSDDDDDSDDEVAKALSYLNKISQTHDFMGDLGFGDDMNMDLDDEDEDDTQGGTMMNFGTPQNPIMFPMGRRIHDDEDEEEEEFHSDEEDEGEEYDTDDEKEMIDINNDDIEYSSMDDDDENDDLDDEDHVMFDEDDEGDYEIEIPNDQLTMNQMNPLFRMISQFVQNQQQQQGGGQRNNTPTSTTGGTSTGEGGNEQSTTANSEQNTTQPNNNNTNRRRVVFRTDEDDEDEEDYNIDMDDDDEDEDPYFDSDTDENVLRKFDDSVEPVQGQPWSDKFTRQEIFRNTEESVNLHLSFCGHQIHEDCFSEYAWSILKNNPEEEQLIDPHKNEFQCVLCRRIGNAIVPVIPDSGFKHASLSNQIKTIEDCKSSHPGPEYQTFLQSLKSKLLSSTSSDEPTPEALKKVRPAIDQFSSRIYGIRYNLSFYHSQSDSVVTPFICSSIASTIANTELAIRTPDIDPSINPQGNGGYQLFSTMLDSHRIDIRSLFRVTVAHGFAHNPLAFEGKLLWNAISGAFASPLPEEYFQTQQDDPQQDQAKQQERLKENEKLDQESFPPLLSLDLFHTFVQAMVRFSDINIQENTTKFHNVARLFYDATITQAIFQFFKPFDSTESSNDPFIKGINKLILSHQQEQVPTILVLPTEILGAIKENCLIFLRRISLFLYACLHVNPPPYQSTDISLSSEVNYLVGYLQLPSFDNHCLYLLNTIIQHSDEMVPLVNSWSEQLLSSFAIYSSTTTTTTTSNNNNNQQQQQIIQQILPSPIVPKTFLLIKLPELYNTLTQQFSSIPCIQCKTVSSTQALCLICGTLCCLGSCCKRFFDQKNECILHAERCNAGTCMFLVIKSSSILLIHLPRKTVWISPYLDDHGEEDPNLRRGKPLYLNSNRYYQLNALLLKHQIDQDSKIAELSSRDI
ncbi:hypothetical protein DLAC_08620 [Tieghemostelium lacteum]|uniref:E3 ubiquitin-protein ligase n=1 Tax=Tieghemostelium lacteum TaxID=361077 RepID=A0A151Z7T9_TIELA|nr:hypothetical protein DLAC_08620 [Tieghemostelium lacteum]|eukprot:KYQ90036.1 hypothetical protein DLAC_08620 [Tieghemostelium lacteum]